MPSSAASRRAQVRDSSSPTGISWSCTFGSSTSGRKSGVQPWILCGFHSLPASSDATSGSVAMICTSGRAALITCPAPVSVPPVPQPVTQQSSRRLAKSRRISGPVVLRWYSGLAGFSNWRARNQPCFSASSSARFTMPLPRSAAGVRITFAPSARITLRRSIENVSTIVATNG
jgi:hypothetical protein